MHRLLPLIAGTWFIVSTNFPMWLNGDKTNPAFNYTVKETKGDYYLDDQVSYQKKGRQKTINGKDFQDKENEKAFTWRGNGLLFFLKSRWEIKLIDSNAQWAVIWFSKTWFTPEGVDIIFRERNPDPAVLLKVKQLMITDPVLGKHAGSLKEPP